VERLPREVGYVRTIWNSMTLAVIIAALVPLSGFAGNFARVPLSRAPPSSIRSDRTAPRPWIDTPTVRAKLAHGGVAVRSKVDRRHSRGTVEAAIRVHASARVIWPIITQCKYAGWLIPGLKRCRTLKAAPNGSWADIVHDIKYSIFLPMVHSVFRADFHPPHRMDFHRIGGNLKYEVGSWTLVPGADGSTTVVYRVSLQPGFWVPHFMIRRMLRKQLSATLRALRRHAEELAAVPSAKSRPHA
jgi:hypothetical protein